MPSVDVIAEAFALWTSAGLRPRGATAEGDEMALAAYATVLGDMPDDRFRRCAIEHLRGSQWWPTPAEIRALARDLAKADAARAPRLPEMSETDREARRAEVRQIMAGIAERLRRRDGPLEGEAAR